MTNESYGFIENRFISHYTYTVIGFHFVSVPSYEWWLLYSIFNEMFVEAKPSSVGRDHRLNRVLR